MSEKQSFKKLSKEGLTGYGWLNLIPKLKGSTKKPWNSKRILEYAEETKKE